MLRTDRKEESKEERPVFKRKHGSVELKDRKLSRMEMRLLWPERTENYRVH